MGTKEEKEERKGGGKDRRNGLRDRGGTRLAGWEARMEGGKERGTEWRKGRKEGRMEESTGRKVGMLVTNDGKQA